MEHKFAGRFTLIIFVLLVGSLGIFWPPSRLFNTDVPFSKRLNLKPGIDISGGTSLTYEIQAPSGTATNDLSQRVADALKKRVDPDGVRNLVWRPQGPTRLEIQMPMAGGGAEANEARKAFSTAQQDLEITNIRASEVNAALQNTDAKQRQEQLDRLAMGSATRKALFDRLAQSMQKLDQAQKANDPVRTVDARDEIAAIERQIDDTNLPETKIRSELDLAQGIIDKAQRARNKQLVADKLKEREASIAKLKQQPGDFPQRLQAIDRYVAAYDAYAKSKGTMNDAEDLKRLLRGSGVLEFHIVVTDPQMIQSMAERLRTEGPTPKAGDTMRWFEIERPDQFKGYRLETYGDKQWILAYVTPDESMVHKEGAAPWGLRQANKDYDPQSGENVVGFEFDAQGAFLFGELSGSHIGKPLGIVLDDKMINAPTLRSRIESRGQISGNFSEQELTYLIRTLNAGSLPAKLADEPISERTVGPSLGADNLRAGFRSSLFAIVAVAVFMTGYYYFAGLVATIAVLMNLVINIGVMAMFNATFTLPGIAALALTVGMAVDANVLIYERLREEQQRGLSLRMALRNAYDRAFSAIFDSNITTIMTSVILYWYGSEEIRGFGLTLTIGIGASMFTALYVTRAIFDFAIERLNVKHMGSLPLTFPKWDQTLKPSVDWMSKAWMFYAFSAVLMVAGLAAYFSKGRDMYDIEFVSGTSVQVELKEATTLQKIRDLLDQPAVAKAVPAAQVVAVGTTDKDYEIVTPNENTKEVREAVVAALGDMLKIDRESHFAMEDAPFDQAYGKTVVPIANDPITVDGFVASKAAANKGGVAIVLKNIAPQLTPRQIQDRIERLRLDPGSHLPYRPMEVDSPNRNQDEPTNVAVVMITDPTIDFDRDPGAWQEQLARPMWKLVSEAITRPGDLGRVSSFNASVANDTKVDALVAVALSILAIAIYVWVRFGDFKYGAATVASLLHDVVITVGLIGLTQYVGDTAFGRALLIDPIRMNLTVVAAILTVMGYSVNDTIVVFDRIRENRGKFGHISREIINDSINQTMSRTLLTGGTTIATLVVMYVWGGPGIHGFTFALLFGILIGTYSSFAIASPLLLLGGKDLQASAPERKPSVGQHLQRAGQ
ncbi:MAG: protein translocase subunit SecD [Bacillota bacterium]